MRRGFTFTLACVAAVWLAAAVCGFFIALGLAGGGH